MLEEAGIDSCDVALAASGLAECAWVQAWEAEVMAAGVAAQGRRFEALGVPVDAGGGRLSLIRVCPYPVYRAPIRPADYLFSLRLSAADDSIASFASNVHSTFSAGASVEEVAEQSGLTVEHVRRYGPAGQLLESWTTEGVTRYHYDPEGNLLLNFRGTLPPNLGAAFWGVPSADCYAGIAPRWTAVRWRTPSFSGTSMAPSIPSGSTICG